MTNTSTLSQNHHIDLDLVNTHSIQSTKSLFDLVVTCADGLEEPLQKELQSFGIDGEIAATGRVKVLVSLSQLYQMCLWSRVASRILLPIKRQNINTDYDVAEQLYGLSKSIDWTSYFGVEHTFAIRVSVDKRVQVNQQFAMLRVKDAIADHFNEKMGSRPDVDGKKPNFAIFVAIGDKQADVYLDLSGNSLHCRGYRDAMTQAPLKENLAAALLYMVDWHKGEYDTLIDPMCGSGTFLIEALLMSCDYPVGLDKVESQFGFYHWQYHDSELWQSLVSQAQERFHKGLENISEQGLLKVYGFDADAHAIKATHKNIIAAGLQRLLPHIKLQQRPLSQLVTPLKADMNAFNQTLVITNPPYGERLGDEDTIKPLYHALGLKLQQVLAESGATTSIQLGVLAAQIEQADVLPIHQPQTLRCHNGAITVYFRYGQLLHQPKQHLIDTFEKRLVVLEEAQDFVNRLQKNLTRLKKHAQKESVSNLRIYDADLPDFNVAIDLYGNYAHVQEYAPPKSIPAELAKKRFNLALVGLREVLGINREQVFIKTRARQSGKEQYTKQGNRGKFYVVQEQDAYFYVNFTDYLDTGLFIDHRNMRRLVGQASRAKQVLNLFAYTCTASVHAALAGAKGVTSVDLSQNYLNWGKQNFALNGLDVGQEKYQFIAADVFEWIKNHTNQYDTIFIDPPTFSNSKKFKGTFDVQRDHAALIKRAMNRLVHDGVLYFSNNFSKFELDDAICQRYQVKEITHETIGFDFNAKKPIHRSYEIRHG